MARIRTVKPELFRHEGLYEAESDTGLPLRLAFIGLFTVADRDGRFRWQPRQLKLDVMPYEDIEFSRVLDALCSRGFIVHYVCSGEHYGAIPTFDKHQVINNRERQSVLPSIDDSDEVFSGLELECIAKNPRVSHASATPLEQDQGEGKGREGKGTEQEGEKEQEGSADDGSPDADKKTYTVKDLVKLGVDEQHAKDWLAVRKTKKAPLTTSALDGVIREAALANLTLAQAIKESAERGWQGFKASWLDGARQNSKPSAHHGFDKIDYMAGVTGENSDGSFSF